MRVTGSPCSSSRLAHVVGDVLLPAGERLGHGGDRAQPLHVRHPVPAGDDQPERKAVLRRKRLPVDLVGEEDLVALRLGDREAPLVGVLDVALDAAVEPAEDDLLRLRGEAGLLEERRERRARPLGRADGAPSHGWLIGRGSISARPLPAHSRVTGIVRAGRAFTSASVSASGFSTSPPTSSCHVSASTFGMSKWISR